MKHTWKVTWILILLFLASSFVGLLIIKSYVGDALPLNIEKPELEGAMSYTTIFFAIIFATVLALLLAKYKALRLWKYWYFFGVVFCLTLGFGAFIGSIALLFAIIFAYFKVFRPNIYVHNFTEVFIYGGLIAYFAESFTVFSAAVLLILISIYDYVAVNKIKHMISLVKFQSQSKTFAGLLVPYQRMKKGKSKIVCRLKKAETAILGGGDIGFPLLFSSAVMIEFGILYGFLVSIFCALSLLFLFYKAEKNKFYPAMPFLTVGCFIGYLVVRGLISVV